MIEANKKSPFTLILVLIIGFAAGFLGKSLIDKKPKEPEVVTMVPIHKVNAVNNSLLTANELIAPDVWRVYLDPLWMPFVSSNPPLPLPPLVNVPAGIPKVQTIQGDKDIQVIVQLPGLKEKDVDVQVGKDVVSVKGEKVEEHTKPDKKLETIKEAFEETIKLPCKVDGDKAKATIKNGVLTISLPRADNNIAHRTTSNWQ